jgi:ABC-2 type transport system ATP-binding protein
MGQNALSINNLHKSFKQGLGFKKIQAVDDLSISIEEGSILGLLGPNGAGKTTTFKIILGLMKPDRGTVRLWGEDSWSLKSRALSGYMPESPYFYSYLTAFEALDFYGSLFDIPKQKRRNRVKEMLVHVGLEHAENRQLRKFSRGMLQRVGIAQALLNDPKFLILDEPMSGLDPVGRKEMRNIILECKKMGKTVIFSSHILSDAEMLCDRAAILDGGRLKTVVDIREIMGRPVDIWEIICYLDPGSRDALPFKNRVSIHDVGSRLLIETRDEKIARQVMAFVEQQGGRVFSFNPRRQSLEDIFVRETNGGEKT